MPELLSPLVDRQRRLLPAVGIQVADTGFTFDDGGTGLTGVVATSAVSTGTQPYVTSRRLVVVSSSASIPTPHYLKDFWSFPQNCWNG
ncbi:hypothetical protein [Tychonema sp. LEGE 07203]|uniref:hypothetical protein n=1 Tax=Tychonema sp. LEGE 07203 TaxID=1828671 RepID=UPI00187DE78F|nr:hypothetical protein [Tychonema sp. LEGE 07203]MBE9096717.1 hypothetical protein [Tychonema sp. LEGE 07203]